MVEGFESLVGARCDIFAKLLYIKASKNLDHCKLSIVDFYNLFAPLKVIFYILTFFSMILQKKGHREFLLYLTLKTKVN